MLAKALGAVVGKKKKKVVFDFPSVSVSSHGVRAQMRNGGSLPPIPWPFSDFMGFFFFYDSILFVEMLTFFE